MHYDPVKYTLSKLLRGRFLRRTFHLGLDLLFLRACYIRKELKRIKTEILPPHQVGGQDDSKFQISNLKFQILDAGMGFGQYSDRLARLFPSARLVGLEIDRAHLYGGEAYFRAVHPDFRFTIADVQILPFKDASFDLIVTIDVMEHIPDDRATFAECARVLRPGGRLLMHTPREKTENRKLKTETGEKDRWIVGEHVRDGYRDDDAREKIETAGLTVERVIRGYGKPGMVAWTLLQRVPMSLLGRSRGFIPVVLLWLLIVIIPAVIAMYLDRAPGDRPEGGSLMVVAKKLIINN